MIKMIDPLLLMYNCICILLAFSFVFFVLEYWVDYQFLLQLLSLRHFQTSGTSLLSLVFFTVCRTPYVSLYDAFKSKSCCRSASKAIAVSIKTNVVISKDTMNSKLMLQSSITASPAAELGGQDLHIFLRNSTTATKTFFNVLKS